MTVCLACTGWLDELGLSPRHSDDCPKSELDRQRELRR